MSQLIFISFLLISHSFYITGTVNDKSGEALTGATIQIENTQTGAITNEGGQFEFQVLEAGEVTLIISHLGYQTKRVQVRVPQSTPLRIILEELTYTREEVIITSSPSGSAVAYRPATSLSLQGLHDKASDNFADILKNESGFSVRSFGSAPSRPVIRGFDGDRVLILENGERMGDLSETAADHAISMDADAAERVELVRGPAGFLYGSSAMGGVVNIFNNDIPLDWSEGLSGRMALTGTSVNEGGSSFGRVTYGIGSVGVSARLSYRNTGSVSTPSGKLSGTFNESVNGAIGTSISGERIQGGLALSFVNQTYGVPEAWDVPEEEIEIRLNRVNLAGMMNYGLNGYFDQARFRFNLTAYEHKEAEIVMGMDGSIDEEIGLEFTSESLSSSVLFIRNAQSNRFSGALGVNVFARSMKVGGSEGLTPDSKSFQVGIFGYQDMPIHEFISLQAGARLDFRRLNALENERFAEPENPVTETVAFSGSVGINARPSINWEVGLQLARSFRALSLEELYTDAAHLGAGAYEIGDPNLKNEIGHGVDLFINYKNERFQSGISSFYYLIDNYVRYSPTGVIHQPSGLPVFIYEGSNARYFGFEADMSVELLRNLSLHSGVDVVQANRLNDEKEALPFIPPVRFRGSVNYDTGSWFTHIDIRHTLEQNRVAPNEETTPGYTLVDFAAGYRFDANGRHLITFRIDNLLNTAYRDHLSRIEGRNNPMPGRGVTIRYQVVF